MRKLLLVLAVLCGGVWGTAFYLLAQPVQSNRVVIIPTLMVLPSLTPTLTATNTVPATPTVLPTTTPTQTASPLPTATATLSTRVLEISALLPGMTPTAAPTDFPFGTVLLSSLPEPNEPLLDATNTVPPYEGWFSFESDNPNIIYTTRWEARQAAEASRGQYHRTQDYNTAIQFAFEGEGLRVRYVAARNMGIFQIRIDGILVDTIDAYAPELAYPATPIYTLTRNPHLLELYPTGQKNPQSDGYTTALDAIQVYRGSANTLILTPTLDSPTPSATTRHAVRVDLIAAPPTLQPTNTPPAPSIVRISVIIAYDENGNRAVDPAEGVIGIAVRVVEATTNRVIATALTDQNGYVVLELQTDAPLRVVVPYFSEVWDVSRDEASFTLLIEAANQPGLIP